MLRKWMAVVVLLWLALPLGSAWAQEAAGDIAPQALAGSSFTYQGRLNSAGMAVNATCDLRVGLFGSVSGGTALAAPQELTGVPVSSGLFSIDLDFGIPAFDGNPRWLEIALRCPTGSGEFTTLTPRQSLTATPYALYAGGVAWPRVSGVPATLLGLAGLNCATGEGPRWNGTAWECANVTGPQGPQGLQGTQGAQGPSGAKGDPGDPGPRPAHVLWVAKSGGDYTTITAALNAITDTSNLNRYLIKIGPGVYTETVTLKSNVSLEGSGRDITYLIWTGGTEDPATGPGSATLRTPSSGGMREVRHMTIQSVASGTDYASAVSLGHIGDVLQLNHVKLFAFGSNSVYGLTALGNGRATLFDVDITARGVNSNNAGNITGIHRAATRMNRVMVLADVVQSSTATTLRGIYNQSSDPEMTDVAVYVTVAGASKVDEVYGVQNFGSSPHMTNMTVNATAVGGNATVIDLAAIHNSSNASPTLFNVVVEAAGVIGATVDELYGVYNSSLANPILRQVVVRAEGAGISYGVYSESLSAPVIRDSEIRGATHSVVSSSMTTSIVNTLLDGSLSGGNFVCLNTFNAVFAPVAC